MFNEKVSILQNLKSSLSALFSIQDIDDHYVIRLFGIKFCKRHNIEIHIKEVNELGVTKDKRNPKIIVSLTTFPGRINTVYKTISTLLQQTVLPDEVVLWLADSQFPNRELPENLTRLQEFGLSIKWCEDIKSFKKLIPSLRKFPEDVIITADDDIFYPENFVESLYEQYLKQPQYIHANRAFLIKRFCNKYSMNARSYVYNNTYLPAYYNEFMTGYGTLFPPNSLDKGVFDSETFMSIIPTNDDIWFWGHAVKNGTKIKVNKNGFNLKLIFDRTVQDCALWKLNMNNTTVGTSGIGGINKMCNYNSIIQNNLVSEFQPEFLKYFQNRYYQILNTIAKLFLEVFILDRNKRRKLKGNLCKWYLKSYIEKVEKNYIKLPKKEKKYRIWQYWDTGLENAPEIIKACMASVDKYKGDIERVILTKDNIKDYVNIPDYIYEKRDKGIISQANFSDILRTYLLVEYGGCWIDATVYLTEPLPQYIKQSELFVLQNDEEKDFDGLNMASYFISSNGNSIILQKLKSFLDIYWLLNDFKFNYFAFLHAFTMFSKSSEENKKEWDSMYKHSFLDAQVMQDKLLEPFSEDEFEKLKQLSPIHKLTYKTKVLFKNKKTDTKGTLLEYIFKNTANN